MTSLNVRAKPFVLEDKAAARRERVRLNVQAHRAKKKALTSLDLLSRPYSEAYSLPFRSHDSLLVTARSEELREALQAEPLRARQSIEDIAHVSCKPRIDLCFGLIPALVRDLEQHSGRYPWAAALHHYRPKDRVLELAVLAAGARFSSLVRSDDSIFALSNEAYLAALRQLRLKIDNPPSRDMPMLSAVVNCLLHFEGSNGSPRTEHSPWGSHVRASHDLMRLAGPKAFQKPKGLMLLRSQRGHVYVFCLLSKQSCFLASEEWATIPFEDASKTLEDLLWDNILRGAELQALVFLLDSHLRTHHGATEQVFRQIKQLLVLSEKRLRDWYRKYRAAVGEVVQCPLSEAFRDALPRASFTQSYCFQNMKDAELRLLYWTSILGRHMSGSTTTGMLKRADKLTLAAEMASILKPDEAHIVAASICQGMEYCVAPAANKYRGSIIAAQGPLQAAYRFYSAHPAQFQLERQWCLGLADLISSRGLFVQGFLTPK